MAAQDAAAGHRDSQEFLRSISSFNMENPWNVTTFQLIRGKHGRCLVYFDGYVYHKNKSTSNAHSRMYWKCSKSQALGCGARAQTLGNLIRTTGPGHNHPPIHLARR
uniref:Putative product n=1 Tax=Xenopsylla cheopis TaxID=163159 RepID=A0A6M2DTU2_XENCH